jgi:hypothetical protein
MNTYIERFNKQIKKLDSCWEWQGAKNKQGYGMFSYMGKTLGAHRFSALINGIDIENKCVCHKCDNPSCVNPNHLFSGTHQDNTNDMVSKGRHGSKTRANLGRLGKRIMTPNGIFNSRKEAARYYNIKPPSITSRMHYNSSQYYYL